MNDCTCSHFRAKPREGVDRIAVPRYVYLYNQLLLRLSEEMTTIRDALGDRFNYDELMGTTT